MRLIFPLYRLKRTESKVQYNKRIQLMENQEKLMTFESKDETFFRSESKTRSALMTRAMLSLYFSISMKRLKQLNLRTFSSLCYGKVISIGSTAAGRQPCSLPDNGFCILFSRHCNFFYKSVAL